jgi:hypothetical protein
MGYRIANRWEISPEEADRSEPTSAAHVVGMLARSIVRPA